jgi:hypothetical protein
MIQRLALLFSLIFFSSLTYSQIKTPDKRPFNIGIFSGIGGVNFTPIPGLELHYKGTLLRVAPGYKVNSIGVVREIMPLSKIFYNWQWIGSLYGSIGEEDDVRGLLPKQTLTTTFYRTSLMTGVKVYFSKRWYSQLQAGASYIEYKTPGYPTDNEVLPYFEFNLGINLFKNYKNEEDFE